MGAIKLENNGINSAQKKTNPVPLLFIHIPRTAGTSICRAYRLHNSHLKWWEREEAIGQDRWDKSYRFTVVRNPWDHMASFWTLHTNGCVGRYRCYGSDFNDWIRRGMPTHFEANSHRGGISENTDLNQLSYFHFDGEDKVHHVGRFEDLPGLCRHIQKVTGKVHSLPKLNSVDRVHYRSFYANDTIEMIFEAFPIFIKRFKYDF